jgi:hypothetical protein
MTRGASCVVLALLTYALAAHAIAPVWNATEEVAIYTSSAIMRPTRSSPAQDLQFTAGTWLDSPYQCASYNVDGSVVIFFVSSVETC